MNLSGESLLVIIVVGVIAGWLAGKLVQGTGFGLIGDLVVGIIGALIASWLFPQLGLRLGTGMIREIIELGDRRHLVVGDHQADPRRRTLVAGGSQARRRGIPITPRSPTKSRH